MLFESMEWYNKVVTPSTKIYNKIELGGLQMKTHYDVDFKKEVVKEYINGKSLNDLYKDYGVAKSTIVGWVKKYSEECQYIKPQNKEKMLQVKKYEL